MDTELSLLLVKQQRTLLSKIKLIVEYQLKGIGKEIGNATDKEALVEISKILKSHEKWLQTEEAKK